MIVSEIEIQRVLEFILLKMSLEIWWLYRCRWWSDVILNDSKQKQ